MSTPLKKRKSLLLALLLMVGISNTNFLFAAESTSQSQDKWQDINKDLKAVKRKILELNRNLFILEEDLLFPASTQLAIFLSMEKGVFFDLDAVKLRINNKDVENYLYTDKEIAALKRGAVQRLHVDNLKNGNFQLTGVISGLGPNKRPFTRAIAYDFKKEAEKVFLEIKIKDDPNKQQIVFDIKEWK